MFERLPLSLSTLVLIAGVGSTIWGFIYYNDPILNLIGIFAGIPLLLGGITMKVVELKPVPALDPASPEALQARETQATTIQKQVRTDITKYNYGANAHMEDALEFLGLKGAVEADLPKVSGYKEELREGHYTLVLRFNSPAVSYSQWQDSHQKKMSGFFGRDVSVELSQPAVNQVELAIITLPVSPQASPDSPNND